MIGAWHLVWILPLSMMAGALLAALVSANRERD